MSALRDLATVLRDHALLCEGAAASCSVVTVGASAVTGVPECVVEFATRNGECHRYASDAFRRAADELDAIAAAGSAS